MTDREHSEPQAPFSVQPLSTTAGPGERDAPNGEDEPYDFDEQEDVEALNEFGGHGDLDDLDLNLDDDDDDDDDDTADDHPSPPPVEAVASPQLADRLAPVGDMELQLTVRCGHLLLRLADLCHLGSGTVLEVAGVSPGTATLCHGETVVAEGELVDIDGRLGLQITRTVLPS